MLRAFDQDQFITTIPHLDPDDPMFHWVFRNTDYLKWSSAKNSQILWLLSPPERNVNQVSSYIVGQEKGNTTRTSHFVLYFFCSSAIGSRSIISDFTHTLLAQIIGSSLMDRRLLIIRNFLQSILDYVFKRDWETRGFREEDNPSDTVVKLLNPPPGNILDSLMSVLCQEEQRGLCLIVDGLDKLEYQGMELINTIHEFIRNLRLQCSRARILLTSRPVDKLKYMLDGSQSIEHDRERNGVYLVSWV